MIRQKNTVPAGAVKAIGLFSTYYFVIMLVNLTMSMTSQLIDTSRTLYVQSLGGSASYAGFMLTLTASAATVTRLLSGRISDLIGRRIVILTGLSIFCLSTVSFNIFPTLGSLPAICLSRGFGMGMISTSISAAISDVVPKARMSEGIGYYGLTQPLAQSIGPAIVAGLITIGDFSSIYFIGAGLLLSGAIIMVFCNYEKDKKFHARLKLANSTYVDETPVSAPSDENSGTDADEGVSAAGDIGVGENIGASVKDEIDTRVKEVDKPLVKSDEPHGFIAFIEKSAIPCAILQFLNSISSSANLSFLMAYAFFLDVPNPALYYTLSAVCMVTLRILTGRFADRFRPAYMIMIGMSCSALAFVCLLLSKNITILFYVAGGGAGIANGIMAPVMQTTVVRMAPDNRRGAAMSTYMFTNDMGIAIGSLIWGSIVDNFDYWTMYGCCIAFLLVPITLAYILLRKVKPARQARLEQQAAASQ